MRNKYIREARISERKFRELVTMFCADVPALTASRLTLVNRKTSQRVYALLRKRVMEIAREEARPFTGEVEIDESYFGPRRVRGRRGRGAAGKTPVIGLLKRGGKVFTQRRCKLFACSVGADHQRPGAFQGNRVHRRLAGLRRPALERLQAPPHLPPRKRVCPWKESRQRHRELLELRQVALSPNCGACERSFSFFISKNPNGVGTIDAIISPPSSYETCASNRCNLARPKEIVNSAGSFLSFGGKKLQAQAVCFFHRPGESVRPWRAKQARAPTVPCLDSNNCRELGFFVRIKVRFLDLPLMGYSINFAIRFECFGATWLYVSKINFPPSRCPCHSAMTFTSMPRSIARVMNIRRNERWL